MKTATSVKDEVAGECLSPTAPASARGTKFSRERRNPRVRQGVKLPSSPTEVRVSKDISNLGRGDVIWIQMIPGCQSGVGYVVHHERSSVSTVQSTETMQRSGRTDSNLCLTRARARARVILFRHDEIVFTCSYLIFIYTNSSYQSTFVENKLHDFLQSIILKVAVVNSSHFIAQQLEHDLI